MEPFKQYYEQYFNRVYAYVLLRVRNAAAAEDVCANAWRKAFEKLDSFNPERGNFAQWIFAIARNETNMYWRLYWVKHVFSPAEHAESMAWDDKTPAQQAEEAELCARLLEAVEALNARERDLISLKFYSGLNNRQIAALTGLSESNAGTCLSRAVSKLRRKMEDL